MESNFQAGSHHLLPQNIEAEESILGGILLDPHAISRVLEILQPEMFSISDHQQIYKAALTLHSQSKSTDLMSVTTWLADRNQLATVGGQSKLAQLVDRTVSAVNIDQYAMLIADKYFRRRIIKVGNQIAQLGYEIHRPLPDVFDNMAALIQSLERRDSLTEPISDILARNFAELETKGFSDGLVINTGLADLDKLIGGFQRKDLVILAGRPSMGKTDLGINLVYNVSYLHNLPSIIFSLEMSKEQLTYRMLARMTHIESNRLRTGRISTDEWDIVSKVIGQLSDIPIYIDDRSNISPLEIKAIAQRIFSQTETSGVIMIDYLQLMCDEETNRVQKLDLLTQQLKGIAKELNVPIICLSQLSRNVETRNNKRPLLSDLRESGGIEQTADLVMFVYRDEYYFPDTDKKGVAEILVGKHRNGSTGTIELFYEKQFSRFLDLNY